MRFALKLPVRLIQVIRIQMTVAARSDEIPRLKIALLRKHVRQQSVGGNVEGHTEKEIGASLIELARQAPACDVELKERMTRQERHLRKLAHVPSAHHDAPRVGVRTQRIERLRNLINRAPVRGQPGTPLLAVYRT